MPHAALLSLAALIAPAALPPGFVEQGGAYAVLGGGPRAQLHAGGARLAGGSIEFAGARAGARPEGEQRRATRVHRLAGSDPARWQRDLPVFAAVRYAGLYPGIDLRYSLAGTRLKSEFRLAPGADPACIRLRYRGFQGLRLDERGRLHWRGAGGEYSEDAPVAYQRSGGRAVSVPARFVLLAGDTVGFRLEAYDRGVPLVLDPALAFSSYLGGAGFDSATAVATDAAQNIYVAGWTESLDFPAASAPAAHAGGVDAFVAKFSPSGQLLFTTYLGGRGDDRAAGIAVDGAGTIWVAGATTSSNFPVLLPRQAQLKGSRDGFLAALLPDGSGLRFSTYWGGSGEDRAAAVALDSGGSVYLAGDTMSPDFPILAPLQVGLAGRRDAFVSKFSSTGTLIYSTFLGGSDDDAALAVAVDAGGAAVLAGHTYSRNFPVLHAAQPASGGGQDAWVAKLHAAGNALIFSTYLGGSGGRVGYPEMATAAAVDAGGNIFVGGVTSSAGLGTAGAVQSAAPGGGWDGFVAGYTPAGGVLFRSYLGGSSIDFVAAVAACDDGVLVAGYTASPDFPVRAPVQAQPAGDYDAFLALMDFSGAALQFATLLGGSGADAAAAVAAMPGGAVIAGQTLSRDFPLAVPAQSSDSGGYGAFVTRVCLGACAGGPMPVSVAPSAGSGGSQVFRAAFSDADGWGHIQRAEVSFTNSALTDPCRLYYDGILGQLGLWNDTNTGSAGTVRPGVVSSAENSRCILYGPGSAVAGSGATLTLWFAVTFKAAFAGAKSVYLTATDGANLSGGPLPLGTWTATVPVSSWPANAPVGGDVWVSYGDVTGDRRADVLIQNAANQFLVAPSPGFQPLAVWLQHGPSLRGQMQYADVNGDGKLDALYFDSLRSRGVWVSPATGNGFAAPAPWVSYDRFGASTPEQVRYADVNGDGKADALYFDAGRTNTVWVSLSTGSSFTAPALWLQHGASTLAQMQYADVNGDGKADALYFDSFRSNGVWVSPSDGSRFLGPAQWLSVQGPSTPDQLRYADVNGDGKADAVYFDTSRTNTVRVALSTGSGFLAPAQWLQHGPSAPDQMQYADVNGDGKADAVYFDTFRSDGVWVALSSGSGFLPPAPWIQYTPPSTPDQLQFADLNGDGKADALYFDKANGIWLAYSTGQAFSTPFLLETLR